MAELSEETTEVVEEVVERMFSAKAVGIGGFLISMASAGVGYFVAERRFRRAYAAQAETEISEMREHFARKELARTEKQDLAALVKEKGYAVPPDEEIAEKVADRHTVNVDEVMAQEENRLEGEVRNIFKDHQKSVTTSEWDYEVEQANRKNGKPYVIHYDEIGETGYEAPTTFTYYAGDDVLCDMRDKIVDDREVLIGDHNLDKFGHGSNDPEIVYIRNDDIAAEFEVTKSERTYAEDVAGLKHSDDSYPRRRRRKFDDE